MSEFASAVRAPARCRRGNGATPRGGAAIAAAEAWRGKESPPPPRSQSPEIRGGVETLVRVSDVSASCVKCASSVWCRRGKVRRGRRPCCSHEKRGPRSLKVSLSFDRVLQKKPGMSGGPSSRSRAMPSPSRAVAQRKAAGVPPRSRTYFLSVEPSTAVASFSSWASLNLQGKGDKRREGSRGVVTTTTATISGPRHRGKGERMGEDK